MNYVVYSEVAGEVMFVPVLDGTTKRSVLAAARLLFVGKLIHCTEVCA